MLGLDRPGGSPNGGNTPTVPPNIYTAESINERFDLITELHHIAAMSIPRRKGSNGKPPHGKTASTSAIPRGHSGRFEEAREDTWQLTNGERVAAHYTPECSGEKPATCWSHSREEAGKEGSRNSQFGS
ncbi:hypothetical protein VTN49DRAFT_1183 [Thermomyces lanuginosus]|uniref:uncharacterized protein n=1 Tax=Thermomyces lanuginosus TaxID=5541 RepID=UPI003742F1A3